MKNTELPFIKDMFNNIAYRYDFLNRLLSARRDVKWRRRMVKTLETGNDRPFFLDVACGTGDVMLEIFRQKGRSVNVVGLDFSRKMLEISAVKISSAALEKNAALVCGDALCLPFDDANFNAITIAFGIRNIADKKTALAEFFRCLKPGGSLAVLELTNPENRMLQFLYMLYFGKILPEIGRLFSKNTHAYSYLPESVIKFHKNRDFAGIIRDAGFDCVVWESLTTGICTLFKAKKPL